MVFVTGTDTGVGKTVFTALLALAYTLEGKKVAISKPLVTGLPNDIELLSTLTGRKIPIFNTYNFSLPAAPIVASRFEGKEINIEKIISDIKKLEKEFDCVIVEGIGGIAVPITSNVIARSETTKQSDTAKCHPEQSEGSNNVKRSFGFHLRTTPSDVGFFANAQNDTYLIADLIKDLNYPTIIVARPSLGTINHTILTIEVAKKKGLDLLGFVISGYDEKTNDLVIKTAPEVISSITGVKCLMKIPLIKDLNYDSLIANAGLLSSIIPNCLANA